MRAASVLIAAIAFLTGAAVVSAQTSTTSGPGAAVHRVVAIYHVKDFNDWYQRYQAFAPNRQAAGLQNGQVFRSVSDPNVVAIYVEVSDLDKYQAFVQSPALQAEQQRGGMIGPPTVVRQ